MVKYAKLRDESARLRQEVGTLQEDKAQRDARIKELDEKVTVLKTAKEIGTDDDDRSAIRQKVNEYIREIDKCIAMLNA